MNRVRRLRYSVTGSLVLALALAAIRCTPSESPTSPVPKEAAATRSSTPLGEDWPMRMHDAYRTGVTSESLSLPLSPIWKHSEKTPPAPAWTESPPRHDYLHKWYDLKPRQSFDRCFDVAVAGSHLYFGSSATGAVTCVDIVDGRKVWTFFSDAPVRFAPHATDGRVYFGSDDGYAYCLDAEHGTVIWKERAGPNDDMIWGNQHMISVWPVRSSLLVDGEDVYWTAGIFPEEGMLVCKRKAADGTGGWTKPAAAPHQGYLLALPNRIIAPTGKTFPRLYSQDTGDCVGDIKASGRDGGCWALVTPDTGEIWTGPTTANETQSFETRTMARVASVRGANCLVVDQDHAYYATDTEIVKLDRGAKAETWRKPLVYPHALIKAGECLFAGGGGEVAAIDADGAIAWKAPVEGNVYGLAAARGRLFVSTDTGAIYCFRATLPRVNGEASASDVTARTAVLHGALTSEGDGGVSVTAFWGPGDGGTEPQRWEHTRELGDVGGAAAFTVDADGLEKNRAYYFRFRATNANGEHWSPTPSVFITGAVTTHTSAGETSERSSEPGLITIARPRETADEALAVKYRVSGTAENGSDIAALAGTVTIPKGEADTVLEVTALADSLIGEQKETVTVTLLPGGYVVGEPAEASVAVVDDVSLDDWPYRMPITFAGYAGEEVLPDFPALIVLGEDLAGFSFAQFASGTGADLRFTDASHTRFLSYEVETWEPEAGAVIWVRVPKLEGEKTTIWAYWGNHGCAGTLEEHATWSDAFAGVWHMNDEQVGPVADATRAGVTGRPKGGVEAGAAGMIGTAWSFDGASGHVVLDKPFAIGGTDHTVSAWVKIPKAGEGGLRDGERVGILLGNYPTPPNANWEVHKGGQLRTFWNTGEIDQSGKRDLRDGQWHHVAWIRDKAANGFRRYIDGELEAEIPGAGSALTFRTPCIIGGDHRSEGCPHFHGVVDELRVEQTARSADWVRACYENQRPGGSFVSYGDVVQAQP